MHPAIRIVLFIILALVSSGSTAPGQQASASPAKPTPAPTPIPLAKVPLEAQSALASLQEIDAVPDVAGPDRAACSGFARQNPRDRRPDTGRPARSQPQRRQRRPVRRLRRAGPELAVAATGLVRPPRDPPVGQLWHIGASTHPGAGLGGGSGHLVATTLVRRSAWRR